MGKACWLALHPTGREQLGRLNPGSHGPPRRGNHGNLESTQHFILVHDREPWGFIGRQFRLHFVFCRNGSILVVVLAH